MTPRGDIRLLPLRPRRKYLINKLGFGIMVYGMPDLGTLRKRAAENGKETIAYARLATRIVETRLVAELHPRHITGWWTESATSSSTATSIDSTILMPG